MRPVHVLFAAFLILPLIEISILIQVGSWLGAITTIALVVFTAVLGAMLVQQQGVTTLQRVQTASAQGQLPATELLEGVAILVGGVLLLTPGFVTDAIGFFCLIRPTRLILIRLIARRAYHRAYQTGGDPDDPQADGRGPVTLDGEYQRVDDDHRNRRNH